MIDHDIGNFALGGIIARRLEDIKLDGGFHADEDTGKNGKQQLEQAWAIMKARVEDALTHKVLE